MKTPFEMYQETAEQFKITGEKVLHDRSKLAFVTEQVQQMQHVANRLLCDLVTARLSLEDAKDETTKAAISGKITGYENDLRQTSMALDNFLKLMHEIEEKGDVGEK